MTFYRFALVYWFILFTFDHLVVFVKCENVKNYAETIKPSIEIQSTQSTLIKRGFSGIFWDHIKSKRNQLNNLSPHCLNQLIEISNLIDSDDPQALKLLSASSHIPNKMFQVSYADLEGFDSCLSIESTHYCQISVLPKKMNIYPHWFSLKNNVSIQIGFCLPRSCSPNEIDNLVTSVVQIYSWEKVRFYGCLTKSTFFSRLTEANASQLGAFILLNGIIFTVLVSSLMYHLDFYYKIIGFKWLRHFALQQTHHNLIASQLRDRFDLLDYYKTIIIPLFALVVHPMLVIVSSKFFYITENLDNARDLMSQWAYQPFNSTWVYNSLLFLGGMSVASYLWRMIQPDTPLITFILMFLKKLFLYWPVIIVAITMKIVLPLLGSGPVYTYYTQWRSDVCVSDWWYVLLHIHNYQKTVSACCSFLWTMNAELHLFVLALLLIYLYKTRPLIAYIVNFIAMAIGLVVVFNKFYTSDHIDRIFGDKYKHWDKSDDYLATIYVQTEAHLFIYSLALLVSCHKSLNPSLSLSISKATCKLISIILTVLMVLVGYSTGLWNVLKIETTPFWYAIHAVACKVVVGLTFSWIAWLNAHNEKVYKILRKINRGYSSNDNSNSFETDRSDQSSIGYKLLFVTSRAYYFTHWTFITWFYARKTKIHCDFSYFTNTIFLILTGYLSGLIFYYLVLGPFESIVASFKVRKFGKFE